MLDLNICRSKAVLFHSEVRKRALESRFSCTRLEFSRRESVKIKKTLFPRLEAEQMAIISQEFELFRQEDNPVKIETLLRRIRRNYIFDKENIALMRSFMVELIEYTTGLDPKTRFEELIYESSWIFINYIGLDDCDLDRLRIEKLCSLFVSELSSKNPKLRSEGLWGISNILADTRLSIQNLDQKEGLLEVLVDFFRKNDLEKEDLKTFLWCLDNLLLIKNSITDLEVEKVSFLIKEIMDKSPYFQNVLKKCVKILMVCVHKMEESPKTRATDPSLDQFIQNNSVFLREIIRILQNNACNQNEKLAHASFKLLSILLKHRSSSIQFLLENGILKALKMSARKENKAILKRLNSILLSLSKGSASQLKYFIKEIDVLREIFLNSIQNNNPQVKRDSLFILMNLCQNCDKALIFELIEMGIVEVIVDSLSSTDYEVYHELLLGVRALCEWGEGFLNFLDLEENPFVKMFEDLGGLQILEEDLIRVPEEISLEIELIFDLYIKEIS